jgi:hypothetical protein
MLAVKALLSADPKNRGFLAAGANRDTKEGQVLSERVRGREICNDECEEKRPRGAAAP